MDNYLIAKATDVGKERQVNEDSMTVFDSPNGQILAVCDGMGGQAAGDVASQLAVSIIESILTDNTFDTPEEAIRRSVMAANQGVLNKTAQNPELEGMGATCVMLVIKNGRVHCGWVGDSRIYYIANHTIRQISHDQSYIQQLLDSGQITKEEAFNHPQKNEIVNCIGLQGMTAPETIAVPIVPEPGSIFLLCSDGLSGMVDDAQIERVLSNSKMSLQAKADRLVAMANEAGGLDNITVELVQFGTSAVGGATSGTLFETPEGVNTTKKKTNALLYSIICILLIAVLALVGGYFFLGSKDDSKTQKTEVKKGKKTEPATKLQETKPVVVEQPVQETKPVRTPSVKPVLPKNTKVKTKDAKDAVTGNGSEQDRNATDAKNLLQKNNTEPQQGYTEKELKELKGE